MGQNDFIIGGILLIGGLFLLPKVLQQGLIKGAFGFGADIQREITGGLTFAESLSRIHTTKEAIPNTNALGYVPVNIAQNATSFYQNASGQVYVNGKLVKTIGGSN